VRDFLWQNGEQVESLRIALPRDRTTSGFWLGDGLFETMLAEDGSIFALERHLQRFEAACKRLHLVVDQVQLEAGITSALEWIGDRSGQVRVTYLSSGDLLLSAREHLIPDSALKLIDFPYQRSDGSPLSGIKSISYGENAIALRYAMERGFDDVLILNTGGYLVESALANLLLWDGSTWWTPRLSSGCLPGVTRELLIEFFGIEEGDFRIDDLVQISSIALTSSLRDIQAVSIYQGSSGEERTFALEPVDRLRAGFQDWRKKNLHP
jgi:branched-chain amino acid aminotransferase